MIAILMGSVKACPRNRAVRLVAARPPAGARDQVLAAVALRRIIAIAIREHDPAAAPVSSSRLAIPAVAGAADAHDLPPFDRFGPRQEQRVQEAVDHARALIIEV